MKKIIFKVLTVILMSIMLFMVLAAPTYKQQETGMEMIAIEMLEVKESEKENPATLEESIVLIEETKERIKNAEIAKQALLDMGYEEDYPAIILTETEISTHTEYLEYYQEVEEKFQEERRWTKMEHDYPAATKVWRYMKEELGWNDYVCAGVMGNFMAETGGQTLALQPNLSTSNYYGIAQWSTRYNSSVIGASLEGQLNYLGKTVEREIDQYGSKYYSGFDYDSFKNLNNEKDAALAFAKTYERCGSGSYSVRQANATKAYNYFVK